MKVKAYLSCQFYPCLMIKKEALPSSYLKSGLTKVIILEFRIFSKVMWARGIHQ